MIMSTSAFSPGMKSRIAPAISAMVPRTSPMVSRISLCSATHCDTSSQKPSLRSPVLSTSRTASIAIPAAASRRPTAASTSARAVDSVERASPCSSSHRCRLSCAAARFAGGVAGSSHPVLVEARRSTPPSMRPTARPPRAASAAAESVCAAASAAAYATIASPTPR